MTKTILSYSFLPKTAAIDILLSSNKDCKCVVANAAHFITSRVVASVVFPIFLFYNFLFKHLPHMVGSLGSKAFSPQAKLAVFCFLSIIPSALMALYSPRKTFSFFNKKFQELDRSIQNKTLEYSLLDQDNGDAFKNTYMTSRLREWAFHGEKPEGLPLFLRKVIEYFNLEQQPERLKRALTCPNYLILPTTKTKLKSYEREGVPRNTPLLLIIKTGTKHAIEAAKIILPYYNKEDLMRVTFRGNTALHIAIFTGQIELAIELLRRAEELGILDEFLNVKNNAGKTASDILHDFFPPTRTAFMDIAYKKVLDMSETCLKGDEVNKAMAMKGNPDLFNLRRNFLEFTKIYEKDRRPLDFIRNESLIGLWLKYKEITPTT